MKKALLIKGILLSTVISGMGLLTFSIKNRNIIDDINDLFDDKIKQVSLGVDNSAAILTYADDDYLFTWGNNEYGKLGLGDYYNNPSYLKPQQVFLNESIIKDVSLGESFSAVITTDSQDQDHLYTWGDNTYGQLGLGYKQNYPHNTPQEVFFDEKNIENISLGKNFASAITTDENGNDHLYTWGDNTYGQLGLGSAFWNQNQNTPKEVDFNVEYDEIKQVSLGYYHSSAIITYGGEDHLYTWGANYSGQLGLGNKDQIYEPKEVDFVDHIIKDVSLGVNFSAAITTDEENKDHLYTWGDNTYGQLGLGNENATTNSFLIPQIVSLSETEIKDVELGYDTSSVITSEKYGDYLYAWGNNDKGYLGLGNAKKINEPTRINNYPIFEINSSSFGKNFSSAIVNDILYTWGNNTYGQLGLNNGNNFYIPSIVIFPYDSKSPTRISASVKDETEENPNATLEYKINVSVGFPEYMNTIIKKIEIIDNQGNSYGYIDNSKEAIPNKGEIILENLLPNTTYDNLKMEVTWNNRFSKTNTKNIGTFKTLDIASPLPPSFNSQTEFEYIDDKVNINYDLKIPTGDLETKDTIINKIEVVDSLGNIYGSVFGSEEQIISEGRGTIELTDLKPGQNYNDLYLKIFYNSTEVFNEDGSDPFGKIEEINISKSEPLKPHFKDNTSYTKNEEKISINYNINVPTGDSTTEDTIINEIKVVDKDREYGSLSSNSFENGIIPEKGSIQLEGLTSGGVYKDLYLEILYNDTKIFNEDGLDPSGTIPEFTAGTIPASEPSFAKETYINNNKGSITIDYYLNVPREIPGIEDTIINKIEVVNSVGNSYGFVSSLTNESEKVEDSGTITLENLIPGTTYDDLYLKVTYNDTKVFNENGLNQMGKIEEFGIPKLYALEPSFLSEPKIQEIDMHPYAVVYEINVPRDNSIASDTIINEIRVVDKSGKTHGQINKDTLNPITGLAIGEVPDKGYIELNSLAQGTTYSYFYLQITYNNTQTFNTNGTELNGTIPEFTIPKYHIIPPQFDSQTTLEEYDGKYLVKYNISLPTNQSNISPTVVNEIRVVDVFGVSYGSVKSINNSIVQNEGVIELSGLKPGNEYDLHIEIIFGDIEVFNKFGNDPYGDIEKITIPLNKPKSPIFNSQTTLSQTDKTYTVGYDIRTFAKDPTTQDTVINKIEVVDDQQNIFGTTQEGPEINWQGEIELFGIQPLVDYDLHIKITYNDIYTFNSLGLIGYGDVPSFTAFPYLPREPEILSVDVVNINPKNAEIEYALNIPSGTEGIEDTIVTKIEVKDSNGDSYGSIQDSNGLEAEGKINIELKPKQTYDDLFIVITSNTFNQFTNINGDDPNGKIEQFQTPPKGTKFSAWYYVAFSILLILIIITSILLILYFTEQKRKEKKESK